MIPWLPILRYALPAIAALAIAAWAYSAVWDRGYASCKAKWDQANAEAMMARDAELETARVRGDALSKALSEKERAYGNLKSEYLTYAGAITGNCPASLGLLVQSAAAGTPMPQTPGASADTPPTAGAIAANIAENYTRAWACIAQLNALIDWHTGPEKAVK